MPSFLRNQGLYKMTSSIHQNMNGIDLMKFLCAILIVIIHIDPFTCDVSGLREYVNFGLQNYICRIAVPFYFVCSGFFLFRKMPSYKPDIDVIKKYCFRIFKLIGIWHVILRWGGTYHLWYLSATVVAVILLSLCFHFGIKDKIICLLACFFYIIGLLGDSYHGMSAYFANIPVVESIAIYYGIVFGTTRNGVFMGFVFVLMGALFSHCKVILRPLPAFIGFVVSMAGMFIEVCLLKMNNIPIAYNMYIFLLPTVYFMFSFAYSIPLKDHAIYKHLRNIGMFIYLLHLLVNEIVSQVISGINKWENCELFFSLTLTIVIAISIEWLSCKEKYKWITWLLA